MKESAQLVRETDMLLMLTTNTVLCTFISSPPYCFISFTTITPSPASFFLTAVTPSPKKNISIFFFFFFFLIIDHLHTLSHTVSSSPSLLTSFTNLSHHPNHHHHPLTTATTGYSGVSPFSFPYKYLRKG